MGALMPKWDLVVVSEDYTHSDSDVDYQVPKNGDVIEACPAGWPFSKTELNEPRWRIIRVDLLDSEVTALMKNPRTLDNANMAVKFREFKLGDMSALPVGEVTNAEGVVTTADIEQKAEVVKP
jgi:hypothetical protein